MMFDKESLPLEGYSRGEGGCQQPISTNLNLFLALWNVDLSDFNCYHKTASMGD